LTFDHFVNSVNNSCILILHIDDVFTAIRRAWRYQRGYQNP